MEKVKEEDGEDAERAVHAQAQAHMKASTHYTHVRGHGFDGHSGTGAAHSDHAMAGGGVKERESSVASTVGSQRPRLRLAHEGNREEEAVEQSNFKFAPTPRVTNKEKTRW